MRKKRKCESCGGVYTHEIRNSAFESENRFILTCPYCQRPLYLVIEDRRLINQEKASKYLKNLPPNKIPCVIFSLANRPQSRYS
jgi:hypothetical protein